MDLCDEADGEVPEFIEYGKFLAKVPVDHAVNKVEVCY